MSATETIFVALYLEKGVVQNSWVSNGRSLLEKILLKEARGNEKRKFADFDELVDAQNITGDIGGAEYFIITPQIKKSSRTDCPIAVTYRY